MEFLMLLHQPTPDAVPDIEVESCELTACASAEAIVVSPSPQNWIEFLEKFSQRPERISARGHLLHHVPKVRSFAGWYLDPRHIAEARVPLVAHPLTEELEALSQIGDSRLLDRQLQLHSLLQIFRKLSLFLLGLLTCTCYENHEVIGISNREEHRPSRFAVRHARPQRRHRSITLAASLDLLTMMRPPLISFLDDTEGDVGKQWRDHPALRSAFVRRQQEAI
jgi:hypothetical protein